MLDRRFQTKRVAVAAIVLTVVVSLGLGCDERRRAVEAPRRPASCPMSRQVAPPMPNIEAQHRTAAYWITRQAEYGPVDEPLLGPDAVKRHNQALEQGIDGESIGQADLLVAPDPASLRAQVEERLTYLRERLESEELVDVDGRLLSDDALGAFRIPAALHEVGQWRLADDLLPLRCGPHDGGLFRAPVDTEFDRNRCSTVRRGELIELLARWPNGMFLARTPYAMGWVAGTSLSAPLDAADVRRRREARETLALTRRAVMREAFSMLGAPYGWGGKGGGYDCSRFLLELFARFGIDLPRHSARQARAGTFAVDVSTVEDLNEKRLLIEAAARRGIVLLHFPGHIMLYLGTTEQGVPMALHSFSEFVTPCDGTDLETINRVDRVAVSDLTLGSGSSRGDFLSRTTRITVIGDSPGRALVAEAEVRPAAPISRPEGRCTDTKRIAIHRSPLRPDVSRPLRIIVATERDPGPASLALFQPDGSRSDVREHVLDGPPFSRWIEVAAPAPGRWTAVLADGDQVLACERIHVAERTRASEPRSAPGPAWEVARQWDRSTENLYSAFIEQLFREPLAEDTTWPNLQVLIADPARNLLYDYRAPGEDEGLRLEPDCADLPYFLRAYFAWKLRLPFVYRMCTRGRVDEPPRCEPTVLSNLQYVPDRSDHAAFRRFARRLANTVHSSSPRTLPNDDETDFYPVRLRRQSLRPGTVYADPYGHVLVVARWKPQGVTDYGVLIGADAQPDGTVGRRRFWRGSFLFTPENDVVGAGFKAWRPVRHDPPRMHDDGQDDPSADTGSPPWRIATNEELRNAGGVRAWSDAQYRGTADDFYSVMQGLINPRPLDPVRMQLSLVDALEESVQRRLSSVDNGEQFMKGQDYAEIEMPFGTAIFLTSGPWEDYSTPSRDMRLLISIDAVVSFPDTVAAHPERFGVREQDRDDAARRVQAALDAELRSRTFSYTRSDDSAWSLTLADVVDRMKAMEMAYNPNDCVEIRWGAPDGSDELSTCRRRAPAGQRQRMHRYRRWFAERKR